MDNIFTLWGELTLMSKIYWMVAIPATLIFAIQIILALVGADADSDVEVDADISDGFGGHIFSLKTIISFLMMFSWSGIIAQTFGITQMASLIVISFVAGIITMLVVAFMLFSLTKLTYSGTMDMNNAIGHVGYVYLPIPEKMKGKGQIQIKVQGSLRTLDAMTEDLERIKSNTNVEVVALLENSILLVKRKR